MRWRELFLGARAALTLGIVLVELIAAVQASVTVTIMPAVAHDLGGLQFYGLVFSAYFLTGLAATPLAGGAADRWGPGRPFAAMVGLFAVGTLLCAVAPSMPVLAACRGVQGFGAAAQYTMAYGAIAKAYPESARARMMTLLSAVWTIPGVLGPAFGSLVASTLGWRWAFLVLLPLLALAFVLTLPQMMRLSGGAAGTSLDPRWPALLAIGMAVLLSSLSSLSPFSIPLALAGLVAALVAMAKVLPAGTFRAAAGLPAAVAVSFFGNVGYNMVYAFFPLLITQVRGRSLAEGGIVVTLLTISWTFGAWWQSRLVAQTSHRRLVVGGCLALSGGIAVAATAVLGAPLPLAYAGWTAGGVGIGIFFQSILMVAMEAAPAGSETTAVAATQLAIRIALAVGTGVGGAIVALGGLVGASLASALAVIFAVSLASSLVASLLGLRLPSRT
jgi:MFS family permease